MPARTSGIASSASPSSSRFQLPALNFNFSSLTEGTNIPPPLPSPIQEEPAEPAEPAKPAQLAQPAQPVTPPASKQEKAQEDLAQAASKINGSTNYTGTSPKSPATTATRNGVKRPAEDSPTSPTHSSRPGSIRRLFSRNLLNAAYANGDAEAQGSSSMETNSLRPTSRSNGSFMDERKSKRSSGFFRRLRSNETPSQQPSYNKRTSMVAEEASKPAGPPPPMIPELNELKAKVDTGGDSGFGTDLFKNIK